MTRLHGRLVVMLLLGLILIPAAYTVAHALDKRGDRVNQNSAAVGRCLDYGQC